MDGVIATKPGWIGKVEVVEVTYDPKKVAFDTLVEKAEKCECAIKIFTRTDEQQKVAAKRIGDRAERSDADVRLEGDKYYLSRTALKFLPMTPMQATQVNERVNAKKDYDDLLAPSQIELLEKIEKKPKAGWKSAIGVDFLEAWSAATALAEK